MIVPIEVKSCYECPHSTNNHREWDDPFTSPPLNIYWYCREIERRNENLLPYQKVDMYIETPEVIDKKCPLNG